MKRTGLILALVTLFALPLSADHIMLAAGDLKWVDGPPSLPKGAQVAILEGDPGAEGIFTIRLRMPANYRISPHWHPAFEHVTVISGAFWMGMGDKFDQALLHEIGPGGFAAMSPGTRHYAMTKNETIIQLHGMGPWQIYYVNAADDPRTVRKE